MIRTTLNLAGVLGSFAIFAAAGCGGMEADETLGSTESALSSFGTWMAIPNGTFNPGNPALIATAEPNIYALGTDSNVWQNFKTSATTWNGAWTPTHNNGIVFAGPPAAANIDLLGNVVGDVALAEADGSGVFYVKVTNDNDSQVGATWSAIPNATFVGQPAIVATPSNAAFGPKSTLFLAGRGTDNQIWFARNAMSGSYNPNNWGGFTAIPNGTFQTAPALTWACPQSASDAVVLATAVGFDNQLYVNKYVGSSWTGWIAIHNGTFQTKPPAIANSCATGTRESLVFGFGGDSRIWFSRDHGTGTFDAAFTAIGTQTFTDGPGATGSDGHSSTVATGFTIAARVADGRLFATQASEP